MSDRPLPKSLPRRSFLQLVVTGAGATLLAACASGGSTTPTAAPSKPAATTAPAAAPSQQPAPTKPAVAASPAASPSAAAVAAGGFTLENPPAAANASAAKQYSGAKLNYYGDAVGLGANIDQAMAKRFTQDTGIQVTAIPGPQSSSDRYAAYQRFFQGQSTEVDVLMVDVIWPGALAPHLLDLSATLGEAAKQHYQTIVDNNTVDGKLVGMPWFGDFGLLYYRTDLLQKYGIAAPPKTWDELGEQAKKILDGERSSNQNFVGFVFQGSAYEGLTCDALEWIASSGGGTIVDASNKVTINNPQAVAILNKVKDWIGTVAPRGVTTYQEEDARNAFQAGNAAFMRNWPYAYALGNKDDSPVKGKFDVVPLPTSAGNKPVGTVGGSQIGASKYSKSPEAAIEFVRYLTSPEVQTYRAVVGSFVPTIPSLADNPDVLKAEPFLKAAATVERVARPSRQTGEQYNEASTVFYQGINQILNGQDATAVLPNVQRQLERLVR